MDWNDTPEQAAFRNEARTFIEERFPAGYLRDATAEHSMEPEDVLGYNWAADIKSDDPARVKGARAWADALAERGWVAPSWPKEYGGAGLGPVEEFILQEEMMRAGVPPVNGIGVYLLGPTLLEHGTPEQCTEHLPKIARGERLWSQGFSEPEAGSDLANVQTRAVREGDDYVVNGQKVWTSLGQQADWLFVLVQTDPNAERNYRGLSYLLVDVESPGVTVRPIVDLRGATPFSEVFFDNVRVPVANRVGEENRGWYVAMATLTFERSGVGTSVKYERVLSGLIDYLRSDEGQPYLRGEGRNALRHEIVQRVIEARVLHNMARYSVSQTAAGAFSSEDASMNQLFAAELHQRVARTGSRIFGPSSHLWQREGAPMKGAFTHMYFDSIATTFLGGTTEIQRNVIATRGLGLPRE